MCIDFMLLTVTVFDTYVHHVEKRPRYRQLTMVILTRLKLQTSNLTHSVVHSESEEMNAGQRLMYSALSVPQH